MTITSRNNAPILNYGGGFRSKSEYPWCIIQCSDSQPVSHWSHVASGQFLSWNKIPNLRIKKLTQYMAYVKKNLNTSADFFSLALEKIRKLSLNRYVFSAAFNRGIQTMTFDTVHYSETSAVTKHHVTFKIHRFNSIQRSTPYLNAAEKISNMRKKILNIIHNTNDYIKKKYASEFRLDIQFI
ncbi:hypothetical protein AGLY_013793 [Aphis glycines]|uniref:Uncharacterized protein n=1 Tax=Aphis glycines TaxID=307491 RepID=A0A6G0T6E4_APHGL|nr:hypothetical protein AGLY_013793 [Aphis glycines]